MYCELFIEHCKVGLHEMAGVEVPLDEFAEVGACLRDHGSLQIATELRIELLVGIIRCDGAKLEPLAQEIFDKALRFTVGEEAFDLRIKHALLAQLAFSGKFHQLGIRHGVPEKIRQARGQRSVIEPPRRLDAIQEIR